MGQVLEPVRDYDVDDAEGNGTRVCFASIQGWRQSQEDDHTLCCEVPGHKGLSFFAVFDGHGGAMASQYAAKRVVQIFADVMPQGQESSPEAVKTALRTAVMKTDRSMESGGGGGDEGDYGRMRFMHEGCTAIMCVVTPSHVVTANVGDSRAIMVTLKNGSAPSMDALSVDQKPNNDVETRRINEAGMTVIDCGGIHRVNGDLAVARALGDFSFKNKDLEQEKQAVSCVPEISVRDRHLNGPQLLCLACDGIWDVIDNQDCAKFIVHQLQTHGEIYTTAARLVDHCLAQGSRDNMSVMIVDLNSKFKLGDRPVYVAPDGEHSEGEGIPLGGAFTTGGDSSNNSADSQSDAAEQK